jgi:hypothetical protein
MSKLVIFIFLFLIAQLIAQERRYTKGIENGYTWISIGERNLLIDDSKSNYLSGILERMRLEKKQIPALEDLICREEFYTLMIDGKSEEISMDDMVDAIDYFYSNEENLVIPILLAYCYCIKFFSDMDEEKLIMFREELLKFSSE